MNDIHIDPAGIAAVLNELPAVTALQNAAQAVVNEARTAPLNPRHGRHEVERIALGDTTETAEGAVVGIDWPSSFWHLVEFGSVNNQPYRPVTRAAQNAGLQIVDK